MTMKKEYNNLILTAGLVLGGIMVALDVIYYALGLSAGNSWGYISTAISFAAIVGVFLYYGNKAAILKDVDGVGFSYGQAFGFSILVALLAGMLIGIGSALMQHVVDPAYYENMVKTATQTQIEKMGQNIDSIPDAQLETIYKMQNLIRKPIMLVVISVISTGIIGAVVALFTSIKLRRQPKMF